MQELNTLNITNSIQLGLKDFMCVSSNGEQFNLNFRNSFGDSLNVADIEAFAANLAKSGAILVSQQGPQETGYWNPMVVTDEKGEAKLTITMPEQSTAWKMNAKGITAETLAGEAELEIVAKKELFGELKLPLAFTDGDDAEILVGVHHDLQKDKASDMRATLKTIIGGRTIEEKQSVSVSGAGTKELVFKANIRRPTRKTPRTPRRRRRKTKGAGPSRKRCRHCRVRADR